MLKRAGTVVAVLVILLTLPCSAISADRISSEDRTAARIVLRSIDSGRPKNANATLKKVKDRLLIKALQWMIYLEVPTQSSFEEIVAFIAENPDWPRHARLHKRAEERMQESMPASEVLAWFGGREPVSTEGWVRLGAALLETGQQEEAITVIRETWITGQFSKSQERRFYRKYRKHLTREDHIARLDRLLWKGSYWPTRRMFSKVNENQRRLAEARFLLRHKRGNVDKAIARVPDFLKNHPGLVYERLRWRRKKGRDESARELLATPPEEMIRPDLWFKERAILARRALTDGLVTEA